MSRRTLWEDGYEAAKDRPITQGMVISWGKVAGFVLPLILSVVVAIWQFSGNTKAAELTLNSELSALKASAVEWKSSMREATQALQGLTVTVTKFQERLEHTIKDADALLRRVERLEAK